MQIMWYSSKTAPCKALRRKDEVLILNEFTLGYGLMSGLSLAGGLGSGLLGLSLSLKDPRDARSSRLVYLVTTLVFLGLWMRLAMVPLWFWTLSSLVPSIPGAMCLYGVHRANEPISWVATGLKPLFPLLYGFWIALHAIDIRQDNQPLLRLKLAMLVPLGALLVVESLADLGFLWPLDPIRVTCCTSAYVAASQGPMGWVFTASHIWGIEVYILLAAGAMMLTLWARTKGASPLSWGFVLVFLLVGLSCLIALVFSLHTELSLRLLTPRHACLFCLWRKFPDVGIASLFAFLGVFFSVLSAFLGGLAGRSGVDRTIAMGPAKTYAWLGVGLLGFGTLVILARFLFSA